MHISKLKIITTESTPEQTQQEGVYTNRLHDNPDQNKADHNNAKKQSITQSELQRWSTRPDHGRSLMAKVVRHNVELWEAAAGAQQSSHRKRNVVLYYVYHSKGSVP